MSAGVFWAAIALVNLVWVVLAPGAPAKFVAFAGTVTAAFLLAAPAGRPFGRFARIVHPEWLLRSRAASGAFLCLFLLPAAFLRPVRIAFLSADVRAALIGAWVVVLALFSLATPRPADERGAAAERQVALITGLFLAWSAALWLIVVVDLGIGRAIVKLDRSSVRTCQSDELTGAFQFWQTRPASEHLFLAWRTVTGSDSKVVYVNHAHPYLLANYAWVSALMALTGVPMFVATNTTPLFYLAVLLVALLVLCHRAGLTAGPPSVAVVLTAFLSVGFLMTTWRFWLDAYRYNTDNPYPLLAAMFVLVYAFLLKPARPVAATVCAVVTVGVSPIYAPMLALASLCLFAEPATSAREFVRANRRLLWLVCAALVAGFVTAMVPRLLNAWRHYSGLSSSFAYRAGLDGDTRYFTNIVQAVLRPCCCYARGATELVLPAILPLAAFGGFLLRRSESAFRVSHFLLFACTPYVGSMILFPQSLSIHPYLYDHLLILPVVIAGAVAMLSFSSRRPVSGAGLLAYLFFMGALLMSNLIAIAQGLARLRGL